MYMDMDEKSALRYVIEDISRCFISDEGLTQELISQFIHELAANSDAPFDEIKNDAYKSMRNALYEVWQYREWENMSPEQAFLYGQLYGSVKLCETREENHQEIMWLNFLTSKYADSELFHFIKNNPGIRHKDLAQRMNITPGRLSQIMDNEDMNELLSSRTLGREKYYFLSPRGELLYQKLEEQKKKKEAYFPSKCRRY